MPRPGSNELNVFTKAEHSAYRQNIKCQKRAGMSLNGFYIKDKYSAPRTIEKMEILGAVWQPIYLKIWKIGQFGSAVQLVASKTAPKIFIFSIVLGAEYLSYVKSIATDAPKYFGYNISVLANVRDVTKGKIQMQPWLYQLKDKLDYLGETVYVLYF